MHPMILLQGTCNIVNYGGESKSLLAVTSVMLTRGPCCGNFAKDLKEEK